MPFSLFRPDLFAVILLQILPPLFSIKFLFELMIGEPHLMFNIFLPFIVFVVPMAKSFPHFGMLFRVLNGIFGVVTGVT